MGTTIDARRTVRVRALFIVAVLALMGALVLQAPRSQADDFSDTNITASFTNVTNLTAGALVSVSWHGRQPCAVPSAGCPWRNWFSRLGPCG